MTAPDLLFISPIMPQRTGNGLAMRAAQMLAALAKRYRVHLFVAPVAGGAAAAPAFVEDLTARIGTLDLAACLDPHAGLISRVLDTQDRTRHRLAYPKPWLSRFCTQAADRHLAAWMGPTSFAAIHVMRLYLAPLAVPILRAHPQMLGLLDLDDDETATRLGLALLHAANDDPDSALLEHAEAARYAALAEQVFPTFDRVMTCSEASATGLAALHPRACFSAMPNVYAPAILRSAHRPGSTLQLLFLGNLSYLPNADAARFLASDILRAMHGAQVRIDIVGGGEATLSADPRVHLQGAVDDVACWYEKADIAVVPLRAGGGTRIKILEAFAHHVPVVATGKGAEGLDVQHGRHLLLADTAEAFAAACLLLHREPDLARSLTGQAAILLREHHTPACLDARLGATLACIDAKDILNDGRIRRQPDPR